MVHLTGVFLPQIQELPRNDANLRNRAIAQLSRSAVADLPPAGMPQALAVLYQLASSPSTASDALALLHELQVHQVELDMQREELHHTRSELEEALILKTALVDHAPAGLLTIDARTVLREINPAGARLLGVSTGEVLGCPLTSLLSAPSAATLHSLLAKADDGLMPETCELLLSSVAGATRAVHATVGKGMTQECFLLVLMAVA